MRMTSFLFGLMERRKLEQFLKNFNKTHPDVKFKLEPGKENISFMHLQVNLSNRKLDRDLHIEATHYHEYRKHTSFHLDDTKKSILYTHTLHLSRHCSFEEDFERNKSATASQRKISRGNR